MCSDGLPPDPPYQVVPSPAKSELELFASFFHQDWNLLFSDFHSGFDMYIEGVSNQRKTELKEQLAKFVATHKSPGQLKKAWFRLGAEGWQADLEIRKTLIEFVSKL